MHQVSRNKANSKKSIIIKKFYLMKKVVLAAYNAARKAGVNIKNSELVTKGLVPTIEFIDRNAKDADAELLAFVSIVKSELTGKLGMNFVIVD